MNKFVYKLLNWINKRNQNSMKLLKENKDKINWNLFSANPSIFTFDYNQMTIKFKTLAEEIIEKAYDPDRIHRLSVIYNFKFKDWFMFD